MPLMSNNVVRIETTKLNYFFFVFVVVVVFGSNGISNCPYTCVYMSNDKQKEIKKEKQRKRAHTQFIHLNEMTSRKQKKNSIFVASHERSFRWIYFMHSTNNALVTKCNNAHGQIVIKRRKKGRTINNNWSQCSESVAAY